MGKSDHWHVGRQDAANGEARYKFQDKHLQKEYDEGYNSYRSEFDRADEDIASRYQFPIRNNIRKW